MLHLIKKWDAQSHRYTGLRYATSEEEAIIEEAVNMSKTVKEWIKETEKEAASFGMTTDRYIDDYDYWGHQKLLKEVCSIEEKAKDFINIDLHIGDLLQMY